MDAYANGSAAVTTARAAEQAPLIHLSAIIAWACYAAGIMVAITLTPAALADIANLGPATCMQAVSIAGFIAAVALIQHRMGIALAASQTVTPGRLCTSGLFRHTRNPIYLAFLLPLTAIAHYSPLAAALSIALYLVATTRFVIANEERALAMTFGADYEAYRAKTPRWLIV